MKAPDLISSAVANTFRAKTRTLLTILAIFVGAFTLTLTNGLGTGINAYIDDTVTSIGAEDVMTVTKTAETPDDAATGPGGGTEGPAEYNPDTITSTQPGPPGATLIALTPTDIDTLKTIDGVIDAQATKTVTPDYIQAGDGTKYTVSAGGLVTGQTIQLAAGREPADTPADTADGSANEIVLPVSYVEPLGFSDNEAALGQSVSVAVTDAGRTQHVVPATIVGVAEESIAGAAPAIIPSTSLTDLLYDTQNGGLTSSSTGTGAAPDATTGASTDVERYSQASIWFDPNATDEETTALKDDLSAAGYTGSTVADQLGTFTTIINAIVLILNAFAVIALLAASFGIVNTLLMSVQERTREIGLMKAMGMGSGKVFTLFSLEAAFIGFLGSAIGAGIAIITGTLISSALTTTFLADLPGLNLIAFDPASIAIIILAVMAIAFLAGTLPAARAAKADPVESLRYE
ncbi:ABC transporter permease [Arthrobacter sedimenti]|uniref:ABC transporter permease n=1 Tax=Arthrobacter sedimenti TaxID=2694931 RepID=UPI000B35488C|nr:ABC transporter permease [Arthrobacter sedimenti]OUM44655.1 permease [Arthrobacter agilis]